MLPPIVSPLRMGARTLSAASSTIKLMSPIAFSDFTVQHLLLEEPSHVASSPSQPSPSLGSALQAYDIRVTRAVTLQTLTHRLWTPPSYHMKLFILSLFSVGLVAANVADDCYNIVGDCLLNIGPPGWLLMLAHTAGLQRKHRYELFM